MSVRKIILFLLLTILYQSQANCKNCTNILPRLYVFKRHVLSRRQRGIIFPKKAFLLLTQAFTKAIIDGRPPGLAYSIEFDMYSELPDTIEGWHPTILNEKFRNNKKMTFTPSPTTPLPSRMPIYTEHDTDYMLPFISSKATDEFLLNHNIWPSDNEYKTHYEHDDPTMIKPRFWHPFYNITRKRHKKKNANELKDLYKKQFWKHINRIHSSTKPTGQTDYTAEDINQWPPKRNIYDSVDHVLIWKYHRAYRERRDLFEQLETLGKIFNFNMKSCIQRAMCEMRNNLKPYGESLMEDILRITLTVPKKLNFDDNYFFDFTQNLEEKQSSCDDHFKLSCPFKVLDFLTATLRTANLNDP